VATEVVIAVNLEGQPSPEYRAQTISRFIHTMNELKALNNCNSLMQIYTGLNLPVVTRLKNTWSMISKADREIMNKVSDLMDHHNNYRNYRQTLDPITETSCIPFISLLLRDLTFIEEDANCVNGDHINFQKMSLLSKIFAQLQDWHGQLYEFEEDVDVQLYFHNKVVKIPDELEQIVAEFTSEEEGNAIVPSDLFLDSDQLGDDLLGELDKFDQDSGMDMIQNMLLVPDVYAQFHTWLSRVNVEDLHCLECWKAMYHFKKANFPHSEYGAIALRELAEDTFNLYLPKGAPKYIGAINVEILQELRDKIQVEGSVITHDFFDEIIEGCYARLDDSWRQFNESAVEHGI